MSRILSAIAVLAATAAFLLNPVQSLAAPKAELWPKWTTHDAGSTVEVDHSAWGRFLKSYLVMSEDGVNRVAYSKVTPGDKAALEGYLDSLSSIKVSGLNRSEQFAYWVNFYNALTIKVILDHYPVEKILDIDISPGFFSVGPWKKKLVTVEGEQLSLDDMEHRILRPIWKDPRVHYAVNCASIGCPNLQPVPYMAATLDATLDRAARDYVAGGRGVFFDGGDLGTSSIYKWFKEDFGGNDRGVIAHISEFAPAELQSKLAGYKEISFFNYNWNLNEAR